MSNFSQNPDVSIFFRSEVAISTPMVAAYEMACAYPRHETAARKAGFEVTRHGTVEDVLTDLHWTVAGQVRGRHREATVTVAEALPPVRLHIITQIGAIEAHGDLQFFEMGRNRCQMRAHVGLIPHTMSARLLVQSLRLSRHRITQRLHGALLQFARKAERRNRRQTGRVAGGRAAEERQ